MADLNQVKTENEDRTRELLSRAGYQIPGGAVERLAFYLGRCERGFETDLRTPFYDGEPREEIIKRLEKEVGFTSFEELTEIDLHEKEKVGSFSIMLPYEEQKENVEKYWHQKFSANETAFSQAVEKVRSILPLGSLRQWALKTSFGLMPKDTSLGLPWLTKDRAYVQSYFERAARLDSPEGIYPCVKYWRGQSAGLNATPKQRVVWGFDHAETIKGAAVLYPVLEALKMRNGHAAWIGDVAVDEAMTRILRKANGRRVISMDYSGFDSSLAVQLLDATDDVIASWFVGPGSDCVKLIGLIGDTVPLVVPWEVLDGRNGGMPSGSVLTNLRDTIANRIAGEYVGIRSGVPLEDCEVLGDDSVFLFSGDMDPGTVSDCVAELGLESNPDKQFVSTRSAHYLQRWHSLDYVVGELCVGVHSPYRTLSGMTGYERLRQGWQGEADSVRWIEQVENCRHHPYFDRFVRFLKNGDKLLKSGIDPVRLLNRMGGPNEARNLLNIASFPFNSRDPSGFEAFDTVRMLRSLG